MAAAASPRAWSADSAARSAGLGLESAAPPASVAEGSLEDPGAPSSEEAPFEDPATSTTAPDLEPGGGAMDLPPPRMPEAPAASRVAPETAVELSRRIQQARQLAARQRKARAVDVVPAGMAREELEIRAGERNVAIYDKQIATGEGTAAIEAYQKYALQTLADVRRRSLARVWGDTLQQADAPRILREHAQRMAELRRIRFLADVKSFSGIVRQTEELMAKETLRFEASMRTLKGRAAPVTDAANPNLAQTSR
jgi:hypothetical protein